MKLKFTILVCSAASILFVIAIILFYSSGVNGLRRTTGESHRAIAQLMASSVVEIIDKEIELTGRQEEAVGGLREGTFLGDIIFDEATGLWKLPIYKSLVDIEIFFKPLENFKIGKTGDASLVDERSYLVFHPEAKPFTNKFCAYNELQKALETKSGWLLMDGIYQHRGDVLTAFSQVNHPMLLKRGIRWWVFIAQDSQEVFEPLNALISRLCIIAGILVIILIFIGLFLGGLFVRPIKSLRDSLEHLGTGDLEHRATVYSGDEIGQLALYFNEMVEGLKKTTTSIANLNKEITVRQKIEERIKSLSSNVLSIASGLRESGLIIKQTLKSFPDESSGRVNEKQKRVIDSKSHEDIGRLMQDIDNLIDIAKIETGQLDLKMKVMDIKELIRSAIFVLEPKIRDKGLDLKLDIPKGKIDIYADADRINQTFTFLVENAIKFTEKGHIEISVKESKDDVECSVTDTGTGIPKEEIPKIFDSPQYLNLSIVKGIIETHNGKVSVESEPGKRTKFTFRLHRHK